MCGWPCTAIFSGSPFIDWTSDDDGVRGSDQCRELMVGNLDTMLIL
jgi:hypothetical protein